MCVASIVSRVLSIQNDRTFVIIKDILQKKCYKITTVLTIVIIKTHSTNNVNCPFLPYSPSKLPGYK